MPLSLKILDLKNAILKNSDAFLHFSPKPIKKSIELANFKKIAI
jgi:hypothetical protein